MTMSHSTHIQPPGRLRILSTAMLEFVAGALKRLVFALRTRGQAPARDGAVLASGRGDGPPDLDELWRDLNKKLGGLFGGKQQGPRGNGSGDVGRRADVPARPEERGYRRLADRRRGGVDLARQRLFHRAGRRAGGGDVVRQVQPHRRCRLQMAHAVPVPGPRNRPGDAVAFPRGRQERGGARHRPA